MRNRLSARHHDRRTGLKVAGLAATILVLGCAAIGQGTSPHAVIEADAQLLAFGQRNKSCQLWTNWQKVCSRTGPGGSVLCHDDPIAPVEASAPFCVRPNAHEKLPSEMQSSQRFCAEMDGQGICRRYVIDRPFNGFHIWARRSNLCKRWVDAGTRKDICTEDPNSRNYCGNPEFKLKSSARPLACAEIQQGLCPASHPAPEGIIRYADSDIVVSDLLLVPDRVAVNGLHCN